MRARGSIFFVVVMMVMSSRWAAIGMNVLLLCKRMGMHMGMHMRYFVRMVVSLVMGMLVVVVVVVTVTVTMSMSMSMPMMSMAKCSHAYQVDCQPKGAYS